MQVSRDSLVVESEWMFVGVEGGLMEIERPVSSCGVEVCGSWQSWHVHSERTRSLKRPSTVSLLRGSVF